MKGMGAIICYTPLWSTCLDRRKQKRKMRCPLIVDRLLVLSGRGICSSFKVDGHLSHECVRLRLDVIRGQRFTGLLKFLRLIYSLCVRSGDVWGTVYTISVGG